MADVEISYNNSVIASLSDSGTEILETNGTFMSDDITVTYTSPGGGGVSLTYVTIPALSGTTVCYTDSTMTAQKVTATAVAENMPSGSIVALTNASSSGMMPFEPGTEPTGLTELVTLTISRAIRAKIYKVNATQGSNTMIARQPLPGVNTIE